MQDTIIKGTGNSRTLKSVPNFLTLYPTYEAFAQALVAGELPVDLGRLNAAGVDTEGTALNKANLLSDATAALFGLDSSAVPDSALRTIARASGNWTLLWEKTTAGSFTWTAPDLYEGKPYEIGVLVIGGGGGGGFASRYAGSTSTDYLYASGGGSGFAECSILKVTPNKIYNGVVGTGGTGAKSNGTYTTSGIAGGTSSFNENIIAYGGSPGIGSSSSISPTSYNFVNSGVSGGQSGYMYSPDKRNLFGGIVISIQQSAQTACAPAQCFNPFEMRRILCAGGYLWARSASNIEYSGVGTDPYTGLHGGIASASGTGNNGTDPGSGGGGTAAFNRDKTAAPGTYYSGDGAPGAVKIYIRKSL